MEPLVFEPSAPFTLGVEVEFQLLDATSFDLSPKAPALLKGISDDLKNNIKPEFIRSMIEICTPVCQNMAEVEQELSLFCRLVEGIATKLDCVIFAASLHPFALLRERHRSPGTRYGQIMNDLQMAGRRMVTQALHVHVGLPDADTAIKVCNGLRPYLPILLALTTSSPFLESEDTGFYSYRTNIFKALPRSGIPETLENWKMFQELVSILNEATILNGIKELWWDVRPHPDFGTVEVRICDLPSRLDEILAIAALIQSLVVVLSREAPEKTVYREIMLNNKWHASRYGLDGTFIAPRSGQHTTFANVAAQLLDRIHGTAEELNALRYLDPIPRIIAEGTSAQQQRDIYRAKGDFAAVIDQLRMDFWK